MTVKEKPVLISVVGPTAVGKTAIGIALAQHYGAQVISADSRQFFREMSIGTAKPSAEELNMVAHHFVDSMSIYEPYNSGQFERDVMDLLDILFHHNRIQLMVGGSGLYCQSVWYGMDNIPEVNEEIRLQLNQEFEKSGIERLQQELLENDPAYFAMVDKQNHVRLIRALEVIRSTGNKYSDYRKRSKNLVERDFQTINIGLEMDRQQLYSRIDRRMDQMIASGLFEEAERLFENRHLNSLQTVGYQEIFGYLEGKYSKEESVRLLKRNSRRYAKRQLTWFKKDQTIQWFDAQNPSDGLKLIKEYIDRLLC